MSKKTESSLNRFGEVQLRSLHVAITKALDFNPSEGDIRNYTDDARKRAFEITDVEQYQAFKRWYVKAHVLKKFQKGKTTAAERQSEAIRRFLESEETCRVTNDRLCDALNETNATVPVGTQVLLRRAKRIVAEILGKFNMDTFVRSCNFSSGATTEFRREIAAIPKKWAAGAHVTKDALPYAIAFAKWANVGDFKFQVVDGNVVFTVLKNHERDRTCAKEATWNMFFQKGLGNEIRKRLRKVGLLHRDAQEIHQRFAKSASLTGVLTTDDLQSASDTICWQLVALLLPRDWYRVIADLRSRTGTLPNGDRITYEKISSMGNGYTFELETLIFYALIRAVVGKEGTASVYGDDLIYPSCHTQEVRALLNFVGFATNEEKSFPVGPFRESCGGHYFNGHDCTPFYIEKLPDTYGEIIELHNNIIAYHANMPPDEGWLSVARECRKLIPRSFWGPMGLSGVIWSEWDEARPFYVKRYQAFYVKAVLKVVAEQRHEYYRGALLAQLWGVGSYQPAPLRCTKFSTLHSALRADLIWEPTSVEQSWISAPLQREKVSPRYVGTARWSERLPVHLAA